MLKVVVLRFLRTVVVNVKKSTTCPRYEETSAHPNHPEARVPLSIQLTYSTWPSSNHTSRVTAAPHGPPERLHSRLSSDSHLALRPITFWNCRVESQISMRAVQNHFQIHILWDRGMHPCCKRILSFSAGSTRPHFLHTSSSLQGFSSPREHSLHGASLIETFLLHWLCFHTALCR